MKKFKSTSLLGKVLLFSGIFDLFGGIYFIVLVGAGRQITNPPTHPFYAILIGSFLICFAYLQIISAKNIQKHLFIIGVVIASRVFYGILFFTSFLILDGFPATFLPTAVFDLLWVTLYIILTLANDEIQLKDLFIPE